MSYASRALLLLVAVTLLLAVPLAGSSDAKVTTFGSPLAVPATLNTAEDLAYPGTNTPVPPAPDAPNGIFHTFHYGADTALWNFSDAQGELRVPATGQALRIEVEGCAQQAPGGPRPLTTIHFQDLTPIQDGGAKVNITSQGFDLPVCGDGGAGASTVTTYVPINLCVSVGDFVGLNESGGYVPNVYRSGVPYQVLGAVQGVTSDSFIKNNGTGNGATLSPSDKAANEGFAISRNEELMMRVTLATGADATHICPGGRQGLPPALPPIRLSPQTDGINARRVVAVAMFCRVSPCKGVATLSASNHTYGRAGFVVQPETTVHLPIRVKSELLPKIRQDHGVSLTLAAVVDGKTVKQRIGVKIF
ncbi:MAG TPA: hypothetical protein VGX69_07680 [Solirubrobacteraceae bacterium]|jgi:hypothetical protein|nr:hypothetical protein [Solirubrobacteraceae bacterium]